jgi:hypothetical protein
MYKGVISPLDFLHKTLQAEAKDVKHATQAIIYWISWPFVFFMYVMNSFYAVLFYFSWFGLMLNTYLVTLGGVRWQPFITDAVYDDVELESTNTDAQVNSFALTIFVFAAIIIGAAVLSLVVSEFFSLIASIAYLVWSVYVFIVCPVTLRIRTKQAKEEK